MTGGHLRWPLNQVEKVFAAIGEDDIKKRNGKEEKTACYHKHVRRHTVFLEVGLHLWIKLMKKTYLMQWKYPEYLERSYADGMVMCSLPLSLFPLFSSASLSPSRHAESMCFPDQPLVASSFNHTILFASKHSFLGGFNTNNPTVGISFDTLIHKAPTNSSTGESSWGNTSAPTQNVDEEGAAVRTSSLLRVQTHTGERSGGVAV